uniref:SHSP domain-containing protein n=1 Tax=Ananas comosus var. bracteatus TaxID=296719 RepID=A0A6V7QGB9_ANACO|nr:unnamed protein product [Ananas comosus var. bracteatus]
MHNTPSSRETRPGPTQRSLRRSRTLSPLLEPSRPRRGTLCVRHVSNIPFGSSSRTRYSAKNGDEVVGVSYLRRQRRYGVTGPSGGAVGRFADPFRILEHIPIGLDRDDVANGRHGQGRLEGDPTSHEIVIDVPVWLKREELKIEVDENRILRVSGERKKEEEKKDEHWHRIERSYGRFWRQFRLPDNVDMDSVSAKLEHGVLTITFAKLAPEQIKGPKVVSIAAPMPPREERSSSSMQVKLRK